MIWIDGVLVSRGKGGVYGEKMLKGHRVWDPFRSKLAALAMLRPDEDYLDENLKVLYLGAANGTTVSHVADYVDTVYAVEFAPRPMQDLLQVARKRKNVVPILDDANRPQNYAPFMEEVDMIYQDVAQPNQVEILLRNMIFLKKGGTLILMLKTRSVDVRKSSEVIMEEAVGELKEAGLEIVSFSRLEPYHRDHAAIVCRFV